MKVLFYRDCENYKNGDVVDISKTDYLYYRNIGFCKHSSFCIPYDAFLNLKKGYDKSGLCIYSNNSIQRPS